MGITPKPTLRDILRVCVEEHLIDKIIKKLEGIHLFNFLDRQNRKFINQLYWHDKYSFDLKTSQLIADSIHIYRLCNKYTQVHMFDDHQLFVLNVFMELYTKVSIAKQMNYEPQIREAEHQFNKFINSLYSEPRMNLSVKSRSRIIN